jgi:hypothetical protein
MRMIDRFLPPVIDNAYRGRRAALWIFGFLIFMKTAMSLNSIFNGDVVATSADGLPLDTYPPGATRTIVSLFAIWGLGHLMLCLLSLLALVRYRSMVPFMFALLLIEHLSRRLIFRLMPIPRTGSPPAPVINMILLTLMVAGLALSLWRRPTI